MFSDDASYCTWGFAENASIAIYNQMDNSGPWVGSGLATGYVSVSVSETNPTYTSTLIGLWNSWGVPVQSAIVPSFSIDLDTSVWTVDRKAFAQNFLQASLNLLHANLDLLPAIAANYYGGLIVSGNTDTSELAPALFLEKVYDLLFFGRIKVEVTDDDELELCQSMDSKNRYTTGEAYGYESMIAVCSRSETLELYLQQAYAALNYSEGLGLLPLQYGTIGLQTTDGNVLLSPTENWRYRLRQNEESAYQGLLTCALIEMASTILHEAIHSAGSLHDPLDLLDGVGTQFSCIENTFKYFLSMRLRSQLGNSCRCWLDGPESDLIESTGMTTTSALTGFIGTPQTTFLTANPCG